jgi:hypothetical protein
MDDHTIPEAQPVEATPVQPATPPASGRAVAALILGILSLICMGFLAGIPAIILGKMELNAIKAGQAPVAGESAAKVGFVLGIIGTALTCLSMIFFFIMIALGISMSSMEALQQTALSI